jgi:hypothetical protein
MKEKNYYKNYEYISQSMLKVFAESPEMFYRRFVLTEEHPDFMPEPEPTEAMILGSLVHAIFFNQPLDEFEVINLPDRRSNEWKDRALLAKQCGKLPILQKQFNDAKIIADSAQRNKAVRNYFDNLPDDAREERELPVMWFDGILKRKAKLDQVIVTGQGEDLKAIIIELKTTASPDVETLTRHYYDMMYHVQAATYDEAMRASLNPENVKMKITTEHFVVAVRNKPPYDAAFYEVDLSFILQGRLDMQALERRLKKCLETNEWSLNSCQNTNKLTPLKWMYKNENE